MPQARKHCQLGDTKIEGLAFFETDVTLSFSENSKGWVSFQSFVPESGVSINNEYYTFKEGEMYKHHSNIVRNNFYGEQYDSMISILFNDDPSSVKSFATINYEGSQARITKNASSVNPDGEYYNLVGTDGWYIDAMNTNLQETENLEFKDKEGKWFSTVKGANTTLGNLDEKEFSVQGIGVASYISQTGSVEKEVRCLTITPRVKCGEIVGCMDQKASSGYNPLATIHDASMCVYEPAPCDLSIVDHGEASSDGWSSAPFNYTNTHRFTVSNNGSYAGPYAFQALRITNAWASSTSNVVHWDVGGSSIQSGTTQYLTTPALYANMTNWFVNGAYLPVTGITTTTDFRFSNLAPGVYYYSITDVNGCVIVHNFTVERVVIDPPEPSADRCVLKQSACIVNTWNDDANYDGPGVSSAVMINGLHTSHPTLLPWTYNGVNFQSGSLVTNAEMWVINPTNNFVNTDLRDNGAWFFAKPSMPSHVWTNLWGWFWQIDHMDNETHLGKAYQYALNTSLIAAKNGYGLSETNDCNGNPRSSAMSKIRVLPSNFNLSGPFGTWTRERIQCWSYSDLCRVFNKFGEYFLDTQYGGADVTTLNPSAKTIQAINFLKNVNTSTPFHGPGWIDAGGLPDNINGVTPYAIDGILQWLFNGNRLPSMGTWVAAIVTPVWNHCTPTGWVANAFDPGVAAIDLHVIPNALTTL